MSELSAKLRRTTEQMAATCSVPMELWCEHSSAALRAADEIEQLRMALGDLLSWFPSKPAPSEWRLRAGDQGADDAIEFARSLVSPNNPPALSE